MSGSRWLAGHFGQLLYSFSAGFYHVYSSWDYLVPAACCCRLNALYPHSIKAWQPSPMIIMIIIINIPTMPITQVPLLVALMMHSHSTEPLNFRQVSFHGNFPIKEIQQAFTASSQVGVGWRCVLSQHVYWLIYRRPAPQSSSLPAQNTYVPHRLKPQVLLCDIRERKPITRSVGAPSEALLDCTLKVVMDLQAEICAHWEHYQHSRHDLINRWTL